MTPLCAAGAKGVAIVIDAGGFNLTDATCVLLAAPGNQTAPESNLGQALTLSPMTISTNGMYAIYTTTGTDFLAAGVWTIWLQVTSPGKVIPSAPPALVYVFPSPLAA